MKRIVSTCCILLPFIHVFSQRLCLVANAGSDTVMVVDYSRGQIIRSISSGKQPQDIRLSPDGKLAYIAMMGSEQEPGNTIAILNLKSYQFEGEISLGHHTRPHWSVVSRNGRKVWTACADQQAIVEVDLPLRSVVSSWKTRQPGSYNFAVATDETKIFTANFDTTTVTIINRSSGEAKIVNIGGKPIGANASPDGEIWISSIGTNAITVFNSANDEIKSRFQLTAEAPLRLVFTPDGEHVLVTFATSSELHAYNARSKSLEWRLPLGGSFAKGVATSPDGKFALVCLAGSGELVAVDILSGKILTKIKVGRNPEGIAVIK